MVCEGFDGSHLGMSDSRDIQPANEYVMVQSTQYVADDILEGCAIGAPIKIRAKAGVLSESMVLHDHRTKGAPFALILNSDHSLTALLGQEGSVGRDRGVSNADTR